VVHQILRSWFLSQIRSCKLQSGNYRRSQRSSLQARSSQIKRKIRDFGRVFQTRPSPILHAQTQTRTQHGAARRMNNSYRNAEHPRGVRARQYNIAWDLIGFPIRLVEIALRPAFPAGRGARRRPTTSVPLIIANLPPRDYCRIAKPRTDRSYSSRYSAL